MDKETCLIAIKKCGCVIGFLGKPYDYNTIIEWTKEGLLIDEVMVITAKTILGTKCEDCFNMKGVDDE